MRGDALKAALRYAALSAVFGFAAAYILCALSKPFIAAKTAALQESLALAASKRQPGIFHARSSPARDMAVGAFSPFGTPEDDPAVKTETPEEPENENIEELALAGTIPNIGAWLAAKGGEDEAKFVSKGESLKGYKLEHVERDRAVLSRDGKTFPLFLSFWTPLDKLARVPTPAANASRPPQQARRQPAPSRGAENPAEYGVKQADPNGADGTVTRETLNELLSNPLAEIGKMRLVPAGNGMRIMGLNSESLFSKLGMKPDDVITNVNGIGISDVGNVSNVISSMLTGARFDFQIERGGEPLKLGYAVE
jgi:type II secretory pathway component PulC